MNPFAPRLRRVLTHLRWRMVIVRFAERIGLMVLIGSGIVAIGWVAAIKYHALGHGILHILWAVLAGVGLLWGFRRMPTLLLASLELDRQTQSGELFSTAWLMLAPHASHHENNPWQRSIIADAEARCDPELLKSVTIHRLGRRTWAAVVLAVALDVVLVSIVSKNTGRVYPARLEQFGISDSRVSPQDTLRQTVLFNSTENRPILLADPDDLNASTLGQTDAPRPPQASAKPPAQTAPPSETDSSANSSPSDDPHGSKAARTHLAPIDQTGSPASADATPHASPAKDRTKGTLANGIGDAAHADSAKISPALGLLTAESRDIHTPPWSSPDWSAQVKNAQSEIDDGRVPAGYRDMVRNYFSPDTISLNKTD